MFRALGFEPEALLADHVRVPSGELRATCSCWLACVEQQWASMAMAGIVESL